MGFSEVFDPTFPPDTQSANQLGQDIRSFKTDIAQRLAAMSNSSVATAEALGWESVFDGMLFLDTTTGKVYVVNSGGSFSEYTPLILSNISESNTVLQAAIVAALAAIPSTSPGPLVLPAKTQAPSIQITLDGSSDPTVCPTVSLASGILTPTQIASCGYVQSADAAQTPQVTAGAQTIKAKIPLTFDASGNPLTFLTIQSTTVSGSSSFTFSQSYTTVPACIVNGINGAGTDLVTVTTGGGTVNGNTTNYVYVAIGVSN